MHKHLLIVVFLLALPAFGQNLPFKPKSYVTVKLTDNTHAWYQPLVVPHRTADRAFWLSTALSLGLTVADIENSHYVLNRPGTTEANPIFGSHPGRARYYGICMPIAALNAYMSYHYKRQDDALRAADLPGHKYVKWWLPNALNTGFHAVGTAITVASTGR